MIVRDSDIATKRIEEVVFNMETERIRLILATPDFFTSHPQAPPNIQDADYQVIIQLCLGILKTELSKREELEKKIAEILKMIVNQ